MVYRNLFGNNSFFIIGGVKVSNVVFKRFIVELLKLNRFVR